MLKLSGSLILTPPARRAPFADNDAIGARGLRTHQRILDAALDAFGESGYDRMTLDRVAELAGCSRVAIYQYVSGKEELFRVLAAQAATLMWAALEALDSVTPDGAGHAALLAYIGRLADIADRYGPIIGAFDAAVQDDDSLLDGATSIVTGGAGRLAARVVGSDLPARLLGPTVELLNTGAVHALCRLAVLRTASPEHYGRERVDRALTDVAHRMLFGVLPGVNDHVPVVSPPPVLRLSSEASVIFRRAAELEAAAAGPGKRALGSILRVANGLIAGQDGRGIRIEDIVAAAGVSRGSFYTYFDDIDDFVRVMGIRAIRDLSQVVRDLPEVPTPAALRRWLHHYSDVNLVGGPLVRVWAEAIEGPLRGDGAAVFDAGRRRFAQLLRRRAIGDIESSAGILLSMVEVFGSVVRTKAEFDAAVNLIDRGFLAPDRDDQPDRR